MTRFPSLLLLPFLLCYVELVKLHITGDLECFKPGFTFLMSVWDFDWHFQNDRLYTGDYVSAYRPQTYSADLEVNDVDELENDMYEIFVSFWHTCTSDGKWMYYESRVDYVRNSDLEVFLAHNVNLTNAHGELTWRDWEDWPSSNTFLWFDDFTQ